MVVGLCGTDFEEDGCVKIGSEAAAGREVVYFEEVGFGADLEEPLEGYPEARGLVRKAAAHLVVVAHSAEVLSALLVSAHMANYTYYCQPVVELGPQQNLDL